MQILLKPITTEKSISQIANGKYVFEIHPKTNKKEVAKVIEKIYKVEVTDVNIINLKPKERRFRFRTTGWTKKRKKALVTIKKGQKISEFDIKEEKKEKKEK